MGIKQLYNDNLRKLPNKYGNVSVMGHSNGISCSRNVKIEKQNHGIKGNISFRLQHFFCLKWGQYTINDRLITHPFVLLLCCLEDHSGKNTNIWKLKKKKKKKKKKKFTKRFNSNKYVLFWLQISYRYKTTKPKPFYGNPIDLIFGSKSMFLTSL